MAATSTELRSARAPPGYVIGGATDGPGAPAAGYATTWAQPSGQVSTVPSTQVICGETGCNVSSKHSHMLNSGCGDPGCGLGFKHSHDGGNGEMVGSGCSFCGGTGCGKCGGHGARTGCSLCGGKGCGHCLGGLKSKLHGKLASLCGGLHHAPRMQYFLGAGGPVPITPGYVPYIVTTRSPRDFFSFPPMNPNDP